MKRTLALVLTLMLALAMTGCSSGSGTSPAASASPSAPAESSAPQPAQSSADPAPQPSSDVIIMRIGGTCTASEEVGEYRGMLKLAELVELYSEGTIKCEVYPASQLGSTRELAESIMLGSIECATIGLDVIANYNPIVYVTSLPYVFDNYDVVRDTLDGKNSVGAKIYESLLEDNIKVIGGMHRGYRAIGIRRRATGITDDSIFTPDDLKGLRIRTPDTQTVNEVVASFGALPVAIANAEIATSLSQGVIDGIDYGFTELWAQKWDGIEYVIETNHAASDVVSMVNYKWFQTLTEQQQQAILRAGQETADFRYEIMLEETERGRQKLADMGITSLYGDKIDMDAFRACAEPLYEQWIGKFIEKELYDEVMALNQAAG